MLTQITEGRKILHVLFIILKRLFRSSGKKTIQTNKSSNRKGINKSADSIRHIKPHEINMVPKII